MPPKRARTVNLEDDALSPGTSGLKKGRGRPRKTWDELCERSQFRRLAEERNAEWPLDVSGFDDYSLVDDLCGSGSASVGQSDDNVCCSSVEQGSSALDSEEVGMSVVDVCVEDGASVMDALTFEWESGFDLDAANDEVAETAAGSPAQYIDFTFDEFMELEEDLLEDEDEDELFDYGAAVRGQNQTSLKALEEKLAIWRSNQNITRTAMTDLLHILHDHQPVEDFSLLPLDSRTITSHTSFVNTEGFQTVYGCAGGTYVHLGIEDQSRIIMRPVKDESGVIIYDLCTDGMPPFRSSASNVWPWMAKIVSIPSIAHLVFLVGAWFGQRSKPNSGNAFMQKVVEELSLLLENGMVVNDVHYVVYVRCLIADAPARCLVLESIYLNGYGSCPKCKVHGSWDGRTFFPLCACENAQRRTHEDYVTLQDKVYHKDETLLVNLPGLDIVKQVPFDPMHLIYRGVMKCLLGLWVAGERPYKLSAALCDSISSHLLECRKLVPADFQRKPRSLVDLPYFKATEFRLFVLYIGPVCVKRELDNLRYVNFLCLHVAVRILADPILCKQEQFLLYAEKLLLKFLEHFCRLYNEKFLTHNFHGLYPKHLVDDVRSLGPMESFSSFCYDNFLGHLKKKIRKGDQALQQIMNRYIEDAIVAIKQKSPNCFSPEFVGPHDNGPLLSYCSNPQCKCVSFKNFKIRIDSRSDSFCLIKRNEIVAVANICWCERLKSMVIVGRKFLQTSDFFDVPCKSSMINIFRVSGSKLSTLKAWPLSDVVCKMFAVPYDTDFVMYPLLHCEL